MAKVHITQTMVQKAEIRDVRYTIRDDTPGLILRVGSSGSKVFYVDYYAPDEKRALHKLGPADVLTVTQAREAAREFLARAALGEDVRKRKNTAVLGVFLEEEYFPWVLANRRDGEGTIRRITAGFKFLWDVQVEKISPAEVEKWRVRRTAEVKSATINKDLTALKAAINWGVKRGLFETHPLARLERLQERDSQAKVRYLSPDERERLMEALEAREAEMRRGRESHNKWLAGRGKAPMPPLADHLKPMVIISLNTGIRRGALFGLTWADADLEKRVLTLRGETAKSGRTNHVPLNAAALGAFTEWRSASAGNGLVFPSPRTGRRLDDCKKAWKSLMKAAQIENFRWHDMRHDFASQLVMKGVDLNTVRELLGHSDMKMTLRYAHLAPEAKARAVAALD